VLTFEGVSVTTDDGAELLRSVDVVVRHGAITVLAGPSGAGKSTLLRLGNRLMVPTSGRVRFHDLDVADLDPRELRRRVGMVFQRPVVFPGTVRDNLLVADPTATEDRLSEVLVSCSLGPAVLDRVADQLSGGEAQRACIARTLLTGPEVVLMDEPTSSLDPSSRRSVEHLARGLADDGLGVLWVTHDLVQAHRLGDELVVLVEGRNADDDETAAYLAGEDDEEAG
jgi:putative ABC transport system ATP-binding protein